MTDTRIYRTELEQPSACGGRWGLYVDGRLIARTDRALAYEHKDQLHNFTASPPVLLDALHTLFKAAPPAPRGALASDAAASARTGRAASGRSPCGCCLPALIGIRSFLPWESRDRLRTSPTIVLQLRPIQRIPLIIRVSTKEL